MQFLCNLCLEIYKQTASKQKLGPLRLTEEAKDQRVPGETDHISEYVKILMICELLSSPPVCMSPLC